MEDFKGTTGPWRFNGKSVIGHHHFNVIGTHLGGKFKIARVPYVLLDSSIETPYNKQEIAEAEANAKLIAAAPELLEALQDMLFHFPYDGQSTKQRQIEDKAHAAINKALGK